MHLAAVGFSAMDLKAEGLSLQQLALGLLSTVTEPEWTRRPSRTVRLYVRAKQQEWQFAVNSINCNAAFSACTWTNRAIRVGLISMPSNCLFVEGLCRMLR